MHKTTQRNANAESPPLTVDINSLAEMLSCGKQTAQRIGEEAKARVPTGGKRVLYSVDKIKDYISTKSF